MTDCTPPLVAHVTAPVSVVWRSPDAPRPVDGPVTADQPDHAAWLVAMDATDNDDDNRHGLLGRIDTQVVAGEPVLVLESRDGWSRVVCPWQPSKGDARGYPGWVRSGHLSPSPPSSAGFDRVAEQSSQAPALRGDVVDTARRYLGLPYLWGGTCPTALDCSGLVHLACREHGVVVPRDGDDQQEACDPVPLGREALGDLYFFAEPGATIHHVGFVTGLGRMLHAPGTGTGIVEEALPQDRRATLVSAGRIRGLT